MPAHPRALAPHRSLPSIIAAALLFAAGLLLLPLEGASQGATSTAFVGVTLIDGNGGDPLEDATLVVTGRRISAIGPSAEVEVPDDAAVVDGAGKFLLPGFIDTNVHISLYSTGETMSRYWERNADLVREAAQLHLKHGVTTLRDSYGSLLPLLEIRDAIAAGEEVGPRLLVAGNIVGWGGPCSISFSLVRESTCSLFEEQVNDSITQGSGEELMNMTPEELRVAINEYIDRGPDFIKFGGTGHFSPAFIGFSEEAQRVMVEEAHRRGIIAETHSTSLEGLRLSLEAGVDLVQHPEILGRREITEELVDMMREGGVVCSMLTNTVTGEAWKDHLESESRAEEDEEEEELDRELTSAERRRRESGLGMEMRRLNAEKLIAGGCISTVGTDNYLGQAPEFRRSQKAENQEAGSGTIIAIEGLVELGMTPAEAIVAATRNGAIAAGALDEYGTLEEGKLADLVLLDADPLEDISNIRALSMVMTEGEAVDLEALPTQPVWHGR